MPFGNNGPAALSGPVRWWMREQMVALQAVGAAVYDLTGLLIMAGTRIAAAPRPKPGRVVGTAHGHRS